MVGGGGSLISPHVAAAVVGQPSHFRWRFALVWQDVLRARVKTTGIVEAEFDVEVPPSPPHRIFFYHRRPWRTPGKHRRKPEDMLIGAHI